jgi:hypothetical protein
MRLRYFTLFFVLFTCDSAFCQTDSLRSDSIRDKAPWKEIEPKPTKLIYIYPVNDDAAWLDFKNGGFGIMRLFPAKVIGVKAIEEKGFRFTPAKEAPEGMMTQEFFDKFYRLNSLVKGIYIPYSEMKSVRFFIGFTIRTKNGKKYRFTCKHPRKEWKKIKAHLKER